MIRDHAVGGIDRIFQCSTVGAGTGGFLDGLEEGSPKIRVVVAGFVLDDATDPLQSHPGVDVLGWKRDKRAVIASIEFDEDQIPDLDHVRVVEVDEFGSAAVRGQVVMDLAAGPAWSGGAHLPEVLLAAPSGDVRRIDVGQLTPELFGFFVGRGAVVLITGEDGDMKPFSSSPQTSVSSSQAQVIASALK